MGLDINTKKLKKNAFRVTKERGIGASRIRVPGGYLNAEVLSTIQEIAQEYGNGFIHLTTRQGIEIEGIRFEDMDAINEKLQPFLKYSKYSLILFQGLANCGPIDCMQQILTVTIT